MKDLESLMAFIAETWICDSERYPALARLDAEQQKYFRVKHSLLHIQKTIGKIATLCEDFDHADSASAEDFILLQEASIKLFVNALKLAEEVGVHAANLLSEAPQYVK